MVRLLSHLQQGKFTQEQTLFCQTKVGTKFRQILSHCMPPPSENFVLKISNLKTSVRLTDIKLLQFCKTTFIDLFLLKYVSLVFKEYLQLLSKVYSKNAKNATCLCYGEIIVFSSLNPLAFIIVWHKWLWSSYLANELICLLISVTILLQYNIVFDACCKFSIIYTWKI